MTCALWAAVGLYLALRHFRWEPRSGERRGRRPLPARDDVPRRSAFGDQGPGVTPRQTAKGGAGGPRRRLMHRAERREQILGATKRAFVRNGFAATGLEDVAREAGVTKVLIYRHFDSKEDLYRAALDDARACVRSATGGADRLEEESLGALVAVASEDPDGFRLLFRHATREPEFRSYAEEFRDRATTVAERYLREVVPDAGRRQWAAGLAPIVTLETIMAWLDAGRPGPQEAVTAAMSGALAGLLRAMTAEQV